MATINLRDMGEILRPPLDYAALRAEHTRAGLTIRCATETRRAGYGPHGAPEPELPGDARLVCTASNRSLAEQF
jgi:hypothetical protein